MLRLLAMHAKHDCYLCRTLYDAYNRTSNGLGHGRPPGISASRLPSANRFPSGTGMLESPKHVMATGASARATRAISRQPTPTVFLHIPSPTEHSNAT